MSKFAVALKVKKRKWIRDLDRGDEVDGAGAGGRDRRADPDAREREAERLDVDGGAEVDAEAVVLARRRAVAVGDLLVVRRERAVVLRQPGGDVEVAAEAEAAAADRDPAVQVDAEVAVRVDPAERVQRREAEEVGVAAEAEEPLALADRLVDVRVRARCPVRRPVGRRRRSRRTDVLSLITSSRLTVPSMWSLNELAPIVIAVRDVVSAASCSAGSGRCP